MALKKGMDEVLALITDPKERAAQQALMEKYPILQDGYLAQADYNRNQDALKKERESFEGTRKSWNEWYETAKPQWDDLTTKAAKSDELQKQLEEQIAKGGDVDQAQLQALVEARVAEAIKGRNYVSQEELTKIISENVKQAEEVLVKQTIPATMEYVATLGDLSYAYREEFKEGFDRKQFSKFIVDNGFHDPARAYDAFVAEKRTAMQVSKAREEGKKEGAEEVRKEFGTSTGVPGSGAYPAPTEGPVQQFIHGVKPVESAPDYKLGDGTAAKLAAQELRSEGKIAPV